VTRLTILVRRIGPYHEARYCALAREFEVTALQVRPNCGDYGWRQRPSETNYRVADVANTDLSVFCADLEKRLAGSDPEVVALTGYSDPEVQLGLAWCLRHGIPTVVMSDSQAVDAPRTYRKEALKRLLVGTTAAGLAAGTTSANYLASLGVPAPLVFRPYDVVDNDYFALAADLRSDLSPNEAPSFLCVARFIEKKNLLGLLDAYDAYRRRVPEPWKLILAGDGPLRGAIFEHIARLGLTEAVSLPGFVQYDGLPQLYASARAFVIPSFVDQWGLVVNEAMAAGLPVLVSERCGCAPDLVKTGENGFLFDPLDSAALSEGLERIAASDLDAMGRASRRIIQDYSLGAFVRGFAAAAEAAADRKRRIGGLLRWTIEQLGRRRLRQVLSHS
jgi:1,2-diacylglycerol 3-alpha-glucosyltransferase